MYKQIQQQRNANHAEGSKPSVKLQANFSHSSSTSTVSAIFTNAQTICIIFHLTISPKWNSFLKNIFIK
jgi:hypothetical protein